MAHWRSVRGYSRQDEALKYMTVIEIEVIAGRAELKKYSLRRYLHNDLIARSKFNLYSETLDDMVRQLEMTVPDIV